MTLAGLGWYGRAVRRSLARVWSAIVLWAVAGCTAAPARLELPEITPAQPLVAALRRGINLGNALDAPSEGEWGVVLTESHFAYAAQAGLDHVRLPVRFSSRAGLHPPYTVDPRIFARVDWAVQQARRHGLAIIIDFHHYEELMTAPDAHADRFVEIWRQVAEHFASAAPEVLFELLNEPYLALDPDRLNRLHARAVAAIRASNPTRTLILDSYAWAAAEQLGKLEFPTGERGARDENLVASFHMYQPILFTHQGGEWMEPWYQTVGVVFPGPPSKPLRPVHAARREAWVAEWFARYNREPTAENPSGLSTIEREFSYVDAFLQETGRPVYMGEFAVIDNADPLSRENWLRAVRSAAETRGIGWAYWDDGGDNLALDVATGSWVPEIAAGLKLRGR